VIVSIGRQLSDALVHLHSVGIIHRDLNRFECILFVCLFVMIFITLGFVTVTMCCVTRIERSKSAAFVLLLRRKMMVVQRYVCTGEREREREREGNNMLVDLQSSSKSVEASAVPTQHLRWRAPELTKGLQHDAKVRLFCFVLFILFYFVCFALLCLFD
jgi:serine/threonine protein kinase